MGFDPETAAPAEVMLLTDEVVRTVDRTGGTFLHTSRTRPDRIPLGELPPRLRRRRNELKRAGKEEDLFDVTEEVIRNLEGFGIDCLVAIGGDDTLGYAHTRSARGFPVVGIPKTMDNDVRGTEYTIGFKTAITRADAFINRQRTHLASHEMVGVFRIFGRNAGFTALGTAMAVSGSSVDSNRCRARSSRASSSSAWASESSARLTPALLIPAHQAGCADGRTGDTGTA